MIKDFKQGNWITEKEYRIEFLYDDDSGYSFVCDENGKVIEGCSKYKYCLDHPEQFSQYNIFRVYENRYREPNTGRCICGEFVELYDEYKGACQCPKCGQWYNLFGQSLIPPEFWEEDEED